MTGIASELYNEMQENAKEKIKEFLEIFEKQYGIKEILTNEEKNYLEKYTDDVRINSEYNWRYECPPVLLWALSLQELTDLSTICNVKGTIEYFMENDLETLMNKAELRSKDEIMDIKYFDKPYILKAIIEITIKDIIINIEDNKKSDVIMIYIPTTLQKIIERGNISKYICKKVRYEIGKNDNFKKRGEIKEKGKIKVKKICTIAKVKKDIEMKKLNKEERNIKVKEKYCYIKGNFLEKYIKENIRQNDIKIMIVDDVYTTGATMKNILEMIENNIMKNIGNEEREKIEYIFFSLVKD